MSFRRMMFLLRFSPFPPIVCAFPIHTTHPSFPHRPPPPPVPSLGGPSSSTFPLLLPLFLPPSVLTRRERDGVKGEKGSKRKPQQPTTLTKQKGGRGEETEHYWANNHKKEEVCGGHNTGKGLLPLGQAVVFRLPHSLLHSEEGESLTEKENKTRGRKKVMCTQGGIEKLSSTVLQLPAYFQTKK